MGQCANGTRDGFYLRFMILLSFTGTTRAILVLVLLWIVLRMIMRWRQRRVGGAGHVHHAPPDGRQKGDVRIERPGDGGMPRSQGPVEDADFEEVR